MYYATIRPDTVVDDVFFSKRFTNKQLLIFTGGNTTNLLGDFQMNLDNIYCIWRTYRCWFSWTPSLHATRGVTPPGTPGADDESLRFIIFAISKFLVNSNSVSLSIIHYIYSNDYLFFDIFKVHFTEKVFLQRSKVQLWFSFLSVKSFISLFTYFGILVTNFYFSINYW